MSLENLAEKSGVALASLSRIENGKGGGTFRTHQRIAEGLGVPIMELYRGLEEAEGEEAAVTQSGSSEAEAQIFIYGDKASAILLAAHVTSKRMLPQMIILQRGGTTAIEQYKTGTERWLFGLEGVVEAAVGSQRYRLAAGGTLYLKASLPHQLVNVGDATAKVLSVTSPVAL